MSKRKKKGESHVRIYAYEMRAPAWQTLSVDARALLVELRALYRPSTVNVVFLSRREAMRRLHIGQRRVVKAFAELIERGWIGIDAQGCYAPTNPHATAYSLENEATGSPGSIPRREYMRWRPKENLPVAPCIHPVCTMPTASPPNTPEIPPTVCTMPTANAVSTDLLYAPRLHR